LDAADSVSADGGGKAASRDSTMTCRFRSVPALGTQVIFANE
jgi:hypothetical protein